MDSYKCIVYDQENKRKVIDLDFEKYENVEPVIYQYQDISKYPSSYLDYTIITKRGTFYQDLDNTLNKKASVVIESKTNLNSKTSLFYNFSSYSIMAIVIYIICLVLSSFNDEKISKRTNVSGMNYKTFNNYLYISSFTFTSV